MAETVNVSRSRTASSPTYSPVEQININWISGVGGVASDVISLAGSILEVITAPSATAIPSDGYDIELLDITDSRIDYLNAQCLARSSDTVEFCEPLVSSINPVAISSKANFVVTCTDSDYEGRAILILKS